MEFPIKMMSISHLAFLRFCLFFAYVTFHKPVLQCFARGNTHGHSKSQNWCHHGTCKSWRRRSCSTSIPSPPAQGRSLACAHTNRPTSKTRWCRIRSWRTDRKWWWHILNFLMAKSMQYAIVPTCEYFLCTSKYCCTDASVCGYPKSMVGKTPSTMPQLNSP